MKAGIIRCRETEDICPGTADFIAATKGSGAFGETGPVEIIGFVSCGGCPGKRAVSRAREMVKRGAELIVLASCISRGNPIQFPCPHFAVMRLAIKKAISGKARIIDWTH
jgi:predicted metal-binding protein